MNNEQRQAQRAYEEATGIHNSCPAECCKCGALIEVGKKSDCPHAQTSQQCAVYPSGTD